jgi:hypothetical protein
MEEVYPLREALVSCAVMILTAGMFIAVISIAAVLIIFWS